MTNSQSSLPDPWAIDRPGPDQSPRLLRGEVLGAADKEARAAPPPLSPWETPRAARADFLRDPQGSTLSPETKEFLMGIFSRARDIIQANVSDLLERAEDPAKTIRLVIMEMEETLVEVRASAARTIADQKEMRRTIVKLEQAQQSWGEKAELALSKGREDLAEAALLEKQKVRAMAEQMAAETNALAEQLSAHEDDILKLEAKLREARARQTSVLARLETAQNRARVRAMTKGARVEEAFSRFDILERRVDLAEGRAEAYDLGGNRKSLDDEIADLRAADAVKAELAALKARLGREG
jgi:phage shock protein A